MSPITHAPSSAEAAKPAVSATTPVAAAPTIALRKRCHPDGIGLSHYVLMDRKAAK